MAFSQKVKEEVFVACGRCCCICHKFCGTKMEVHHIVQKADNGPDTFDNAIPLCFDCHADMGGVNPHHPKGNSYTPSELRQHRNAWYRKRKDAIVIRVFEDDRTTFQRICEVFNPLRASLIDRDMYEGVHQDQFMNLFKMVDKREDPYDEFLEPDLESLRGNLISEAKRFVNYFVNHTFLYQNKVVPHLFLLDHEDITSENNRKMYEEELDKLNEMASDLWKTYQVFVRQIRAAFAASKLEDNFSRNDGYLGQGS